MKRILAILLFTLPLLDGCSSPKTITRSDQGERPAEKLVVSREKAGGKANKPDASASAVSLGQRTNLAEVIDSFDAYRLGGELVVVVSFRPDRKEAWLGEPLRLVFVDRVDAIGDEVNIVSEEFEGKSIAIVTFRVLWNGSSVQINLLAATGKDPRQYGDLTFYFIPNDPIPNDPASCYKPTAITKTSESPYATFQNAFYDTKKTLVGQCTWYAYGRVIELVAAGKLNSSAATTMHNAFWGKFGRDAKNWPKSKFLGGTWTATTNAVLPIEQRKPGMLVVWIADPYGHVGFVEEVSEDKMWYRVSDFNRVGTEEYRDTWYQYETGKLLGVYPSFYQL